MSDTPDGTAPDGTPEGEGSDDPTPTQTDSPTVDPIALARKRQAGAEAARAQAEKARDAALKELEAYRSKDTSAASDESTLKERLEFEQRRADEAEARANARILDTFYPNARKELPEVTDEVRLAKFEALLREDPEAGEPPTPQNPNESNRASVGSPAGTKAREESSDDIISRLKSMPRPDWLA